LREAVLAAAKPFDAGRDMWQSATSR
jgi:hypothetical protein